MAGERRERIARGKCLKVAAIERRTLGEVRDIAEGTHRACLDQPPSALLRQAFHQSQSQAQRGLPSSRRSSVQSQSLDSTATARTSTPCARASRTSCAGA